MELARRVSVDVVRTLQYSPVSTTTGAFMGVTGFFLPTITLADSRLKLSPS